MAVSWLDRIRASVSSRYYARLAWVVEPSVIQVSLFYAVYAFVFGASFRARGGAIHARIHLIVSAAVGSIFIAADKASRASVKRPVSKQ